MKRCIVFVLLIAILSSLPVFAAESPMSVPVYADPTAPTVTVDGKITQEEWGKPDAVFTHEDFANESTPGWHIWNYTGDSSIFANQSIELYARRDDTHLYFAFRFVNAHHIDTDEYSAADAWQHAGMRFALGAYNEETNIETGKSGDGASYEKWLAYTLRPKYNAAEDTFITSIGAKGNIGQSIYKSPVADCYVDEDNLTYSYEVALAFSDMYGVITVDTKDIVLSFEMTDACVAGKECGNRWFVSKAERLAYEDKNKTAFYDNNPIHIMNAEAPEGSVVPDAETETDDPTSDSSETEGSSHDLWIIVAGSAAALIAVVLFVIALRIFLKKENQQ